MARKADSTFPTTGGPYRTLYLPHPKADGTPTADQLPATIDCDGGQYQQTHSPEGTITYQWKPAPKN